jgi:hypothetical protein
MASTSHQRKRWREREALLEREARLLQRCAPKPIDSEGKPLGCAIECDWKVGELTIATGVIAEYADNDLRGAFAANRARR